MNISIVFSWHLYEARKWCMSAHATGTKPRVGGPAVKTNPEFLADFAEIDDEEPKALAWHNPLATFTSRGCSRSCGFCAVPTIEGPLQELTDWEPKPIVCDNNLLACSRKHFDTVVDRLKGIRGVDFNQGLDARLFTKHHANRLRELDIEQLRFAWDFTPLEFDVMRAIDTTLEVGFPKSKITVFALIGFNDTPEDALYRLQTLDDRGIFPFPMRYQPLDTKKKNRYVGPNWENWLLNAYMRYWANRRITRKIPFNEWLDTYRHRREYEKQEVLPL